MEKSSLQHLLRNDKYIGTYRWKDIVIEHGIPQLVSEDTFLRVQALLKKGEHKSGHYKAVGEEEYILSGKLYCGHCKSKMKGHSADGKSGQRYRYYICNNKHCNKKTVPKDLIEDIVFEYCCQLFTPEIIALIAKKSVELSNNSEVEAEISRLEKEVSDRERQISNLLDSIAVGISPDRIAGKVSERENEIKSIKEKINVEKLKLTKYSEDELRDFLTDLIEGFNDSWQDRKMLIDLLVTKIYIFDDYIRIYFDFEDRVITEDIYEEIYEPYFSLDGVWINPDTVYQQI